jgi:hypothetical protein
VERPAPLFLAPEFHVRIFAAGKVSPNNFKYSWLAFDLSASIHMGFFTPQGNGASKESEKEKRANDTRK